MRLLIFAAALCVCLQAVSAEEYYADVVFDVESSGRSSVSGRANHPLLEAGVVDSLTSKMGGDWLFNLTLPEGDVFSEYVYAVRLPEDAAVSHVESTGQFRIVTDGGRITVRGVGEGMVSVVIQYGILERQSGVPVYVYVVAAAALLGGAGYVLYSRRVSVRPSYDDGVLTDRQRDILRIVSGEGKAVNQALVCERLGLPKSSVSRNVDGLVRLGLLRKTRTGMSTMLSLPGSK